MLRKVRALPIAYAVSLGKITGGSDMELNIRSLEEAWRITALIEGHSTAKQLTAIQASV